MHQLLTSTIRRSDTVEEHNYETNYIRPVRGRVRSSSFDYEAERRPTTESGFNGQECPSDQERDQRLRFSPRPQEFVHRIDPLGRCEWRACGGNSSSQIVIVMRYVSG